MDAERKAAIRRDLHVDRWHDPCAESSERAQQTSELLEALEILEVENAQLHRWHQSDNIKISVLTTERDALHDALRAALARITSTEEPSA